MKERDENGRSKRSCTVLHCNVCVLRCVALHLNRHGRGGGITRRNASNWYGIMLLRTHGDRGRNTILLSRANSRRTGTLPPCRRREKYNTELYSIEKTTLLYNLSRPLASTAYLWRGHARQAPQGQSHNEFTCVSCFPRAPIVPLVNGGEAGFFASIPTTTMIFLHDVSGTRPTRE